MGGTEKFLDGGGQALMGEHSPFMEYGPPPIPPILGTPVWNFQNGESFSPFPLILWESVRFVQTLPPPQEVLSISWDLQAKFINRLNFSLYFEEIKFLLGFSSFSKW